MWAEEKKLVSDLLEDLCSCHIKHSHLKNRLENFASDGPQEVSIIDQHVYCWRDILTVFVWMFLTYISGNTWMLKKLDIVRKSWLVQLFLFVGMVRTVRVMWNTWAVFPSSSQINLIWILKMSEKGRQARDSQNSTEQTYLEDGAYSLQRLWRSYGHTLSDFS